jgi:serine/threonine-protein kinase RsbT
VTAGSAIQGMTDEARVPLRSDGDLVIARQKGRALAAQLGFSSSELTLIATAISELARNIIAYAKRGEVVLRLAYRDGKPGIVIVASDQGPGIADVDAAMQDGYSTSGGLGLGLPGVRRIVDEFAIVSAPGQGTQVTIAKWKR